MDFGICVASKIDEVGYITHAENLGYSHAWVADSQMIWSDCYAVLALAAQQTRKIKLGTGVAVAGTRLAPVTANSIATINRLAPGRTFLGLGTGNTAMRLMGHKPMRLGEFRDYVRVLRALLRGEEVAMTLQGHTWPVQFLMQDDKFIELEAPIPIYISGFGPKAQALAGECGDGLVMSTPPQPEFVERALTNVRYGAERTGRQLDERFYLSSLTTAVLLQPGESLRSERVLRECGAFVISSLHYLYDKVRQFGGDPPRHVRSIWKEYSAMVEATPPSHRHLRIHAGHCTYLLPEEAQFVTPELIKATCLAGTVEEIIEQVRQFERAGLHQIMLLPSLATQYQVIEDFARLVMARL
jgi:alkanesulfonate monooxygenase SsuD/methylene tetrahydromethanopterin reductase-like flavin-dependent oxidoreductase (luciferase family)